MRKRCPKKVLQNIRLLTHPELESPGMMPHSGVALGGSVADGEGGCHLNIAPVVGLVCGHYTGVGHHLPVPFTPPTYVQICRSGHDPLTSSIYVKNTLREIPPGFPLWVSKCHHFFGTFVTQGGLI